MLKATDNIEDTISDMVAKESKEDSHKLGFGNFSLTEDQRRFVNRMVALHGGGLLFRSKSGTIELQIADPRLLEQDGDKELASRHLYINVDKVVKEHFWYAARCVKDGHVYDVRTLLSMLPLEQRLGNIPRSKIKRRISYIDKLKFMVRDENGNLVPPGPGQCTPLDQLEPDHPAIEYVRGRGFEPARLVAQFSGAFCDEENSAIGYKRLPGGFTATPQGRIVFFINQLGVCRGWQARQLDRKIDDRFEMWHPYEKRWAHVANRVEDAWQMLPRYDGELVNKGSTALLKQKYVIGVGVEKSTTLMGFDAARDFQGDTIGIVEGVLDAARLGPPFCSIMGLCLSTNQAALIANNFRRVIAVPDNDHTPDTDRESNASIFIRAIQDELGSRGVEIDIARVPIRYEDAGALDVAAVANFRKYCKLND